MAKGVKQPNDQKSIPPKTSNSPLPISRGLFLIITGVILAGVVAVVLLFVVKPGGTFKNPAKRSIIEQTEEDGGNTNETRPTEVFFTLDDIRAYLSETGIDFQLGNPVEGYDNYIGMIPGKTTFVQAITDNNQVVDLMFATQIKGDEATNSESIEIAATLAQNYNPVADEWIRQQFGRAINNQEEKFKVAEVFSDINSIEFYYEPTEAFNSVSAFFSFELDEEIPLPPLPRPKF